MDDIAITGDDVQEISDLTRPKNLGPLWYFLRIKVARSKKRITLSQREYVLYMLSEASMLGCKTVNTLMEPNLKLLYDQWSFWNTR